MSRSALRTRLAALERKLPLPEPSLAVVRSIVSPSPEPGGPPIDEGIAERITTQVPGPGYPALVEIWEPWVAEMPMPLTKADAARFFELIGQARLKRPSDEATHAVRGFVFWRNAPDGPAVARYGRDGLEVVTQLWR